MRRLALVTLLLLGGELLEFLKHFESASDEA
jgi:hypothetical protein